MSAAARGLRIGIDARTIYRPELRGIGKTLFDLLEAMQPQANGHEFVLYYEARRDVIDRIPPGLIVQHELVPIGLGLHRLQQVEERIADAPHLRPVNRPGIDPDAQATRSSAHDAPGDRAETCLVQ